MFFDLKSISKSTVFFATLKVPEVFVDIQE